MIRTLLRRFRYFLNAPVLEHIADLPNVNVGTQRLLTLTYQELAREGRQLPSFEEVGFREFSGSNEDGILLYIFALIGHGKREFLDVGAAGIRSSNVANLVVNHGWTGTLIDANSDRLAAGQAFYAKAPDIWRYPPTPICQFVTTDNISSILREADVSGDIDFLSLDIDGMDYWIWKAISIEPRVVIVEYSDIIGPDRAITVPYNQHFNQEDYDVNSGLLINYGGASLGAFVKLGKQKGYRLVGCTRYGLNAFFMRECVGEEYFPEIPIGNCFKHPRSQHGMAERWPKVADMPWIEV